MPLPDSTDWLGFCRRAAGAARDAVHAYATTAERGVETGRGEGGDTAYGGGMTGPTEVDVSALAINVGIPEALLLDMS